MNSLQPYNQNQTHFGFHLLNGLLHEAHEKKHWKNILLSPISLNLALGLVMKGANDETCTEIAQLLGYSDAELELYYSQTQAAITHIFSAGEGHQLLNAMSLWLNQTYPLKTDFVQWGKDTFDAQVNSCDFSNPKVVNNINDWVKQATHQHIDHVIDRLTPSVIAVLVNAIYFKGSWQNAFAPSLTKPGLFNLMDGENTEVQMMNQKGKFNYSRQEQYELLQLPYKGELTSLVIILPSQEISLDPQRLLDFSQSLTSNDWLEHLTKIKKVQGAVAIPRVKLQYSIELSRTLQALGLKTAFSETQADFSLMCNIPPRVYISEVLHKTSLDINEEGTEASAATKITMVSKAMVKSMRFVVDRPFYSGILHKNGNLLFHGWIFNPNDE